MVTIEMNPKLSSHIPIRGAYVLIIFVPEERCIKVGKLAVHKFKRGYYTYTGSALGKGALSLWGRISRHLKKEKRKRWHIDFLLADEDVKVLSALMIPSDEKIECKVNKCLQEKINAKVVIPKFGSSDCKERCKSHLLYLGNDEKAIDRIFDLFKNEINGTVILRFK